MRWLLAAGTPIISCEVRRPLQWMCLDSLTRLAVLNVYGYRQVAVSEGGSFLLKLEQFDKLSRKDYSDHEWTMVQEQRMYRCAWC